MIQLKSPREIKLMRRPGLAVWKAHQIAAKMMVPGATTAQIDAAVEEYFRKIGAEPLFLNYPNSTAGRAPFPAVTCMSVNEEVVHGIPSDKPLVEGDIVSIDTGCRLNGWCGDAALTHPIGRVSPEVQKLLDVTREVLELAIEQLNHRTRWSQVADQMARFVATTGSPPSSASSATVSDARCTRSPRCPISAAGGSAAASTSTSSPVW